MNPLCSKCNCTIDLLWGNEVELWTVDGERYEYELCIQCTLQVITFIEGDCRIQT